MKRILLLVLLGILIAIAVLYGLRLAGRTSNAAVTGFLPRETVAFVHLPDFNRTRNQWYQSDIYQLYREPAVQEFLRHPLKRSTKDDSISQAVLEIEQLDPKDVFFALTSLGNDDPKYVIGFRFRGSAENAERIIGGWRSRLLEMSGARREQLDDQQHKIDIVTGPRHTIATVYDRDWFFASNDLTELKAVLHRARHPAQNRESTLGADQAFRSALSRVSANYALCFYVQPKAIADKVSALGPQMSAEDFQRQFRGAGSVIGQIRNICGTTGFEKGKLHDVFYIGMSRLEQDSKLTRSSLSIGSKETFFYLAVLLNLGQKLDAINQAGSGGVPAITGWGKVLQTFAATGLTAEEWKSAFGMELSALADWPASAHWPWPFVAFPVHDSTKANKIVEKLTGLNQAGTVWKQTEKDGARYFAMQSAASFMAITPTVALSDRFLIAGLDPISVEMAMKRSSTSPAQLAGSASFKTAEEAVPSPTNFFAYIDLALLYSRLDAALRPMLFMGAAFMPRVNDHVDLSKLPPAEIVTKHLSPIVSSQRYKGDGYVAESIGPITLNQSGVGTALLVSLGSLGNRKGPAIGLNALGLGSATRPATATPSPRAGAKAQATNPSVTPTPTGTP